MFKSFFSLLIRCYRLALPYGRFKLFSVMGLILFNGILQLVGVTSIFPFFALAADPDRLRHSKFGTWFLHFLPQMDNNHLLVVAGSFSIGMLVFASLGSVISEYIRIRYAYGFGHWLRKRVLESYTSQPYSFFLRRNSTDLYQRISDIGTFVLSVLLPLGEALTRLLLVVLLVGTVFLVQPLIALGSIVLLGGFYLIVFLCLRPKTRHINSGLQVHFVGFYKNTQQLLHGIKTVMVHGKSDYFREKALEHSLELGILQSKVPIYSNGPRYAIEPIAFGGLVGIVIVLALQGRPFSDILPNLMVMAMAGYRLLPALQLLFGQLVSISANNYTLTQLEEEILQLEHESVPAKEASQHSSNTLTFQRAISLQGISFSYPGAIKQTLENFTLQIRKNESIGIAGPSGSGKSTLVDLLLGLHKPTAGTIKIDGISLTTGTMHSWRHMIGYVPQDIYLIDDTIEANIAFGIPADRVNHALLREAANGAQILDFIDKELPSGFNTTVGERGVRLSGGQRQRIGLARALYNKPQILVLDEATSALDHQTEVAVMETIHRLQGTLTIITIAHRMSTLEKCDRIIQLSK